MSETRLARSRTYVNPSIPPTEPEQQDGGDTSIDSIRGSTDSSEVIVIHDTTYESGASSPPRRRRRRNDFIDLTCSDATAGDVTEIVHTRTLDLIDLTQSPSDTIPPPSVRRVRRTRFSGRPPVPLASERRRAEVSQPATKVSTGKVPNDPPLPPTDPHEWFKCPVCMCTYNEIKRAGQVLQSTFCGHIYCSSCISRCLKTSKQCPTCRKKITPKLVHRIYVP